MYIKPFNSTADPYERIPRLTGILAASHQGDRIDEESRLSSAGEYTRTLLEGYSPPPNQPPTRSMSEPASEASVEPCATPKPSGTGELMDQGLDPSRRLSTLISR